MCECRPISRSPGLRDHPAHRLRRVAAGQREAELLVLVRGRDELVGVRLDADRHPDHHRDRVRRRAMFGQPGQPGDLVERVDDDGADLGLHRGGQLAQRLVGAVQRDPRRRESGPQREFQLTGRADVQGQPLVVQPVHDLGAQERLSGVVHALGAAEGVGEILAAAAEVGLVDHHQRGAVGQRQIPDVGAGQAERAVVVAGRAARPDVRVQQVQVGRSALRRPVGVQLAGAWSRRMRPHIRSGAVTPSTARPLASTCWVAAHSQSRATVASVGGSSPIGSTRTES